MEPDLKSFLSPRDLAKAIGASESSLKRWVDDGRIRVSRTAGGHRRIPLAEAVRFIRSAGITLEDPGRIGLPVAEIHPGTDPNSMALECAEMFKSLRGREVEQRLFASFLAGASVAEICDGPIRVALQHIGEIYKEDPSGITIEHAAVEHCVRTLNTIRNVLPPTEKTAPLAIGGATKHQASIVWRTSNDQLDAKAQREELQRLEELRGNTGCTSVVGGGGFDAALADQFGSHSFEALVEFSGFARGFLVITGDTGNSPSGLPN